MANLKTQIEAGASYTDLAALADQLAADYTAVQEAADALSPVSYTHLDVYKRQHLRF